MDENIKLPQVRPSQERRQELQGIAGDLDTFVPRRLSKAAQKREQKVLEETKIRLVVTKARAVLEKLSADYRVSANYYTLRRYVEEIDRYEELIFLPQSAAGQKLAAQAVEQWIKDLYAFLWDLSRTMDEQTQAMMAKDLYPDDVEVRDWLDSLGAWMGKGK